MGKKPGHNGKGSGIGREDFLLWKSFTRDIAPLETPDWDAFEAETHNAPQQKPVETVSHGKASQAAPAKTVSSPDASPQLDGRTDARLRRGQMPVEARLDLHGHTQEQAHERLNEFVTRAQAGGKRCVLVITGKGLSRGGEEGAVGVLRQKLPLWLSLPPLREIVLKSYPAVQRDGGTGAWYLYLKRQRGY